MITLIAHNAALMKNHRTRPATTPRPGPPRRHPTVTGPPMQNCGTGCSVSAAPARRSSTTRSCPPSSAPWPGLVDVPLSTVCGNTDPAATSAGMAGWADRTTTAFSPATLSWDHDALRTDAGTLLNLLEEAA
ncbi:hypothetical protein EAH68_12460 [Corynebacterium hylobatis]|uniref:Uncharacterized protein n=1 Tax=Corynebacterium hylobatis TaxID=1859290 RepID=A0A430HVT6_9CORY|nr:hypothetical protein [Corynebacterium hylobatis]RSZ61584.1 hypothetical protein EAH68_12460 [Corynebacterium hylobatis]